MKKSELIQLIKEELVNLKEIDLSQATQNDTTKEIQSEVNSKLDSLYKDLYKKYKIKFASPISQAIYNYLDKL